jgi:hypothetical protein
VNLITPTPPFRLTQGQRTSETWQAIKAHLERDLQRLRERNDSESLTAEQTSALRGQIAHCKAMLALEKDLPIPPPDSE